MTRSGFNSRFARDQAAHKAAALLSVNFIRIIRLDLPVPFDRDPYPLPPPRFLIDSPDSHLPPEVAAELRELHVEFEWLYPPPR